MKKAIFYSSIGGVLEFYDFIIFAVFAPAITATFFPTENRVAGLLLTFTIFAAGYLVRPIGGLIFGHIGDRYGRKKTFTYSIIIMAMSTFLIALIPSYAKIGIAASILLALLRLIQGASIGGEIPGAITFIAETASRMKTLACSIIFFGLVSGIVLGELVNVGLTQWLSASDIIEYGWRIAFALGGVIGIWGFYLRRKLVETHLFKQMQQKKVKVPFFVVIKEYPLALFSGWALMGLVSAGIMVPFLIMPAYAKIANIPMTDVFLINTLILFIVMLVSIIFGYLGDKVNKKLLLLMASLVPILFSYSLFKGLIDGSLSLVTYTIFCIFSFGVAVAIVPAVLAESFPTTVRYSGVGIAYNLSFATTGGLAPLIIFSLISKTGSLLIPAVYYIAISIIALIGLILYPKNIFDAAVSSSA